MLTNVTRRLTAAERAREPRLLHVVACFDGYGQANGAKPSPMPRRLTTDESRSWREGWAEARAEKACHNAHGFLPCTPEAHDLNDRETYIARAIAAEAAALKNGTPS